MDFQTAFQMLYNRLPTLDDYSASMYDQGQSIINQATALQNQVVDEGVMGAGIPLTTEAQVNQFFVDDLGRPFTDGSEILNIYGQMTPEQAQEFVATSPEALIFQQSGGDLSLEDRTKFLEEAKGGLLNTQDVNLDGVVNINDLLFNMGAEGIGDPLPVFEPINNQPTDSSNNMTNQMSPVSGLNFMPTNLTGQFYGINPTTNTVELMSNMASNPMFRSGVAGFTETLPTGFEFGTPNVYRNISSYTPETFEEFVAQKEAEEKAERENKSQRDQIVDRYKTNTDG